MARTKGPSYYRSAGVIAVPLQDSSSQRCTASELRAASVQLELEAAERRVKELEAIIVTQAEQVHRVTKSAPEACANANKQKEDARFIEARAEMKGLKDKLRALADRECGCVACLEAPATNVMIPCGHLLYCDRCAPKSRAEFGDVCTVCNRAAKQFKIYRM